MHNKHISYRAYRIALHLYPKSYRREYGSQMVQTLQDMLDDADNFQGRAALWLRILAETPMSALKENINHRGENGMNKLTGISNKRLVVGGISIAFIAIVVTFGLWRNSLVGRASNVFYGNSLRTLTAAQNSRLADPFALFTGRTPRPTSDCAVGPSSFASMHIDCGAGIQKYTKLGQSVTDKTKTLASVQTVERALKVQGYTSGSNGVTLTSLVTGTYEGKDYSPDAFYLKTVGKESCVFDTTVAYSNPAQPAINMAINCDRTFNIFGKPAR